MKRAIAIIGAAFGDEGKGTMVNFFTSQHGKDCLVVRFNGSAQSSHTVVMPDGCRHVFAHIGSGSFQGAATYLSEHFVCHPILFLRELEELSAKCAIPPIYVDKNCYVSTPYDMLINQAVEKARGDGRHGSCGIGFGETIERTEVWGIRITVNDLLNPDTLADKFDEILGAYLPHRLARFGIELTLEQARLAVSENVRNRFIDDCRRFLQYVHIVSSDIIDGYERIIFEGAQGLLLDQGSRFYPHVTRSNTGLKNVVELICSRPNYDPLLEVIYITRAYTTRHGTGPMPYELFCRPYPRARDETNITNTYQGSLRFSYLNLDLLKEALKYDYLSRHGEIDRCLAITCMDQIDEEVKYILDGEVRTISSDRLPCLVESVCKMQVRYLSLNPISPERR